MREMLQDIVEKRFLSINEPGKEGWKILLLVLKRGFLEQAGGLWAECPAVEILSWISDLAAQLS